MKSNRAKVARQRPYLSARMKQARMLKANPRKRKGSKSSKGNRGSKVMKAKPAAGANADGVAGVNAAAEAAVSRQAMRLAIDLPG